MWVKTQTQAITFLIGVLCLWVAAAMHQGWNPYELAPVLQQAEMILAYVIGGAFLLFSLVTGIQALWWRLRRSRKKRAAV